MSAIITAPSITDPNIAQFLTLACVIMLIIFLVQRELTSASAKHNEGLRIGLRLGIVPLLLIFSIVVIRQIMASL
jgi:uncharacterized membrane protein